MTLPATFAIDTPGDAARAAELRHVSFFETLGARVDVCGSPRVRRRFYRCMPAFSLVRGVWRNSHRRAAWPTGTPSWRSSIGRWVCRSRAPRSSRATRRARGRQAQQEFMVSAFPRMGPDRSGGSGRSISARPSPTGYATASAAELFARFALQLFPEAECRCDVECSPDVAFRQAAACSPRVLMSIDLAPLAAERCADS